MKLAIAKMLDKTYRKIDLDECVVLWNPDETTRAMFAAARSIYRTPSGRHIAPVIGDRRREPLYEEVEPAVMARLALALESEILMAEFPGLDPPDRVEGPTGSTGSTGPTGPTGADCEVEGPNWPMLVWNFLTHHVISGVLFDGERVRFNDERDVDKDLSNALLSMKGFKVYHDGGIYRPGENDW